MASKHFLIAPVALLAFAAQTPDTLTPEGPATLYSDWHGAQTAEGEHPELLTGFRVVVQPGGRAGTIRFLVHAWPEFASDGPEAVSVGPPVTLPAEPGTYTFAAPHVFADYRNVTYGIEQETGGHAITAQNRCSPEDGDGDICASQSVDVYRPPLGGAIPDRRTASEVQRGRQLTIEPITEPDVDRDGAGDETEDRTNLRASATTQPLGGHRRAFDVTVENAGPRTADRPLVKADLSPSPGLGAWTPACVGEQPPFFPSANVGENRQQACTLAPLAAGASRTVRFVVPDFGFGDAYFDVSAEGPDLADGDQFADPRSTAPVRRCRWSSPRARSRSPTASRSPCARRARAPCASRSAVASRPRHARSPCSAPASTPSRSDPHPIGPRARDRHHHRPLGQRHRARPPATYLLTPQPAAQAPRAASD